MVSAANMAGAQARSRQQAARAEAALWVVRAHDNEEGASGSFDQWLGADAANRAAYGDTIGVWDALGQVLPDWKREPAPAPLPKRSRRLPAGIAAFASVLLLCLFGWHWYAAPTIYRTAVGARQTVMLADGSRVTLNTGSELQVERFGRERRLRLMRGEVLFDVAHDANRPFIVDTPHHYVRAVGTSFVVRREEGRFDVTLLSGIVEVGLNDRRSAVRLSPGERYREAQGAKPVLDRPRLEVVTAWRGGELVLDNTSLREAVAEINRYRTKPIVLQDGDLGALRMSGVFKTADNGEFAGTVSAVYGLAVHDRSDAILLARR